MPDNHRREEKNFITQSPEIIQGTNPRWVNKLSKAFPAFESKNYRLYFFGQLVSMIGTWLQIVAQGWLVLRFTNSPVVIGLIAALATLPTLLFTLFGGVLVDRFPKKKVLLITQFAAMILAFILGILTLLDIIQLYHIGVLAFLLGTVNSLDAPARQAFVSDMVNKEQLPSAIALNSGIFNAARAIGPGVAGLLIVAMGTGGAFIVNGITYAAVIMALAAMNITTSISPVKIHPVRAIKEGIKYSADHPIIKNLLLLAGMVSVFGWSYTTLLPLIAKTEFKVGAAGLGYFYTAGGLGSLTAAILVAILSNRISAIYFIIGGNMLLSICLFLFTLTHHFYLALLFLFLTGMGLVAQASTINSTVQTLVKPEFRGRVMSIYVLMFIGLIPLGNLQIGWVSEHFGIYFAIRTGCFILFVFGGILFYFRHKIRNAYSEYRIKSS